MASDRTSAASLLERLEIERSTFDDTAHPLAKYQQDGFHLCCDLLRENIVPKPTKHGYARLRARTLLLDVFAGIGAEVFVLCTLAMPITDLSKVPHKHTVPKLREWWKKALHPPGLTTTATELCAVYAIETLATPARKRPPQEYSSDSSSSKRSRTGLDPLENSCTRPEGRLRIASGDDELGSPESLGVLPKAPLQNFAPGDAATLLPNQPSETVFDLSPRDLFGFFQKHEAQHSKLQMICPWNGSPLPSINIGVGSANGLSGKVELSVQTALKLIEYVNDSTGVSSASEVAN